MPFPQAEQIVGVVLVGLGRIGRVLALALPDDDDVVALGERDSRRIGERRLNRLGRTEDPEELHEARAPGLNVDVVLNVVLRLILGREFDVPRLNGSRHQSSTNFRLACSWAFMLLWANEGSTLRATTTNNMDTRLIVIRIASSLSGPEQAHRHPKKRASAYCRCDPHDHGCDSVPSSVVLPHALAQPLTSAPIDWPR